MFTLAVVVFHLLGVLSSIHAIMNTRTEQGAIARPGSRSSAGTPRGSS